MLDSCSKGKVLVLLQCNVFNRSLKRRGARAGLGSEAGLWLSVTGHERKSGVTL